MAYELSTISAELRSKLEALQTAAHNAAFALPVSTEASHFERAYRDVRLLARDEEPALDRDLIGAYDRWIDVPANRKRKWENNDRRPRQFALFVKYLLKATVAARRGDLFEAALKNSINPNGLTNGEIADLLEKKTGSRMPASAAA